MVRFNVPYLENEHDDPPFLPFAVWQATKTSVRFGREHPSWIKKSLKIANTDAFVELLFFPHGVCKRCCDNAAICYHCTGRKF